MLFSTRKVAPKINQRISVLCTEEKAVAAEYHNNVQLNSPETVRPQDTFLFGYAQLRNNWRGCCPPITASNKSEENWSACLICFITTTTVQLGFSTEILAEYSDVR